MPLDYSLSVLYEVKNTLQEKISEIEDGKYSKHPEAAVQIVQADISKKLKEVEFAIEILQNY